MINEIMVVADPMCSWCWGFSPVLDQLIKDYQKEYKIKLYLGGLRVGEEYVLNEEFTEMLRKSWTRVTSVTGQNINFDFLKNQGFIYNTEPSCRAVAVVREIAPEKVFDFLHQLHYAFYIEGQDISDYKYIVENVKTLDVDIDQFSKQFNNDDVKGKLLDEFDYISNLGVQAFPSVLLHRDTGFTIICQGFHPYYKLKSDLDNCFLR